MSAILVSAVLVGTCLFVFYRRRGRVRDPTDDWPLRPPVELSAHVDENGHIELVVDDEPPLLKAQRRDLRICEACGRKPVVRICSSCRLRLCANHRDECPECGASS